MFQIRILLIIGTMLTIGISGYGQSLLQKKAINDNRSQSTTVQDNDKPVSATAILTDLRSRDSDNGQVGIFGKDFYQMSYIFNMLFIGAVSLLVFLSTILLVRNNDPLYLYYAIFLILCIMGAFINTLTYDWKSGISYAMTPLSKRTLESVSLFAISAYSLFAIRLLDVKKQDKLLFKCMRLFLGAVAVYGIFYWPLYPLVHSYEVELRIISRAIILPLAFIGLIWVGYRIQSVFKNYFILASVFYFVGSLLAVIRQTSSNIPFEEFYQIKASLYFQVGIFFDILVFTLAITHRLYLSNLQEKKDQQIIQERISSQLDKAHAIVLSSQMQSNPHFIFNSLSSIKYLVQSNQNQRAVKAIDLYSKFIRKLIETEDKPFHSLREEMELMRLYIKQELNRFAKKFRYTVVIPDDESIKKIQVPPLFLLPYVEEIIWQSVATAKEGSHIFFIKIQENENNQVLICIEETNEFSCYHSDILPTASNADMTRINNQRLKLFNKNSLTKIKAYMEHVISEKDNLARARYIISIKKAGKK